MLIKLKKQRVIPTTLLGIFYFTVALIITYCLTVVTFIGMVYFAKYLYQLELPLFAVRLQVWGCFFMLTLVLYPSGLFFLNRFLQKKFFKNHPLTPLYLFSLPFLASLMSIHATWTLFLLEKLTGLK
jgi:hypothetical protein